MKRIQILLMCLLLTLTASSMAQSQAKITISNDIYLHHLADSIYMHETWITNQNGRFPCNGLIVIKQGKAVMIDIFPDVKTVVPGHGSPGGKELLTHTIELVEASRE